MRLYILTISLKTSGKNKEHETYKYLLGEYWGQINGKNKIYMPKSNEVWSGDITYIRTANGMMYLAAIIDWHLPERSDKCPHIIQNALKSYN